MSKLIIFPDPLDSRCELTLDNGTKLIGTPDTHSTGRPGQSFNIPESSPNGNGCQLFITKDKYVPLLQRSILTNGTDNSTIGTLVPYLISDDFHLSLDKVCPEVPPTPIPPNPIPPSTNPLDIINAVYRTGLYNLSTKDGCGKFTEACCTELHNLNSQFYGHIKKFGAQNNYNGHATDAVMLLAGNGEGIWDIIIDSESPNAKPSYNYKGEPIPDLWYYPA